MKIFVSYASEHRELAERVYLKLTNQGHEVFFDRRDLQPGLSFDIRIRDEIERCDLFVFLLARESIEPGAYALTEVELVRRKWPDPEGRVLVVDLGNLQGQGVPPYLRANILLAPTGDPATETLFAVQGMVDRLRTARREGAAPRARDWGVSPRWLLPVGVASLLAIVALGPRHQSVQAVNGSVAAGGSVKIGKILRAGDGARATEADGTRNVQDVNASVADD
jgi:hypothetical protein